MSDDHISVRVPNNSSVLCEVDSVFNSLTGDVGSIVSSVTNDVNSEWNGGTSFLGSLGDGVYGTLTSKSGITGKL